MTTKRFGHQDIKDYILGKLTPEQVKEIENAIANDLALKKIYTDYSSKKDLLLYYETMQFTPEESDAGYKRVLNSRKKPVWAPGQVWEINDLGRMIILSVNNLFQCRGTLLSKSIQFAGTDDIIFKDKNIAATELCAYNGHIFTINPEHLTAYSGELHADVLSIFRKTAAGQKVLLPKGYTWGEENDDPEAEIWHEYISEVLNEFIAEALETYENASENQKLILDLISPNHSFDFSEPFVSYMRIRPETEDFVNEEYEMQAEAEDFDEPESITLHKGEGIKVEAAFDKRHSAVKLIFTFISDDQIIKILDLKQEAVSIFSSSDILIQAHMADCLISEKAVLARLAVLPLLLIVTTDKTTYSVKLDVRKS